MHILINIKSRFEIYLVRLTEIGGIKVKSIQFHTDNHSIVVDSTYTVSLVEIECCSNQ